MVFSLGSYSLVSSVTVWLYMGNKATKDSSESALEDEELDYLVRETGMEKDLIEVLFKKLRVIEQEGEETSFCK